MVRERGDEGDGLHFDLQDIMASPLSTEQEKELTSCSVPSTNNELHVKRDVVVPAMRDITMYCHRSDSDMESWFVQDTQVDEMNIAFLQAAQYFIDDYEGRCRNDRVDVKQCPTFRFCVVLLDRKVEFAKMIQDLLCLARLHCMWKSKNDSVWKVSLILSAARFVTRQLLFRYEPTAMVVATWRPTSISLWESSPPVTILQRSTEASPVT
jgi:hypothetical protein